ncbi:STAS domain-containing protein [Streptomyces sp. NPDC006477]|uniref:STAS domain-containing protein n=1 Tax=Streptomyces sp. NPDC006477 TaxID=3364747 RepID=UPI003682AF5A
MSLDEAVTPRCADGAGGDRAGEQGVVSVLERAAVTRYERHGACVVVPRGSYDMESIDPLAAVLAAASAERRPIVLDASGVTFADSALLNLLILTRKEADLRLAAPTPQLQRILEITGVDTILKVRTTVEDAAACPADGRC